jgi:hypothetical protein
MIDWPSKLIGTSAPTSPTSRSYAVESLSEWPIKRPQSEQWQLFQLGPLSAIEVAYFGSNDLFGIDLLDLKNGALRVTTILALECSLFPTRLIDSGFRKEPDRRRMNY